MNISIAHILLSLVEEISTIEFALLISGAVLLGLAFLTLLIIWLVFRGKNSIYFKRDLSGKNNVRVYRYDYAHKIFYCFDKFNPSNVKEFNETQFLEQYRPSDRYIVQDWLKDIAHKNNFSRDMKAYIKINKTHKLEPTMLEFISINRKECFIHFESHLCPTLLPTPDNLVLHKKRANYKKYILADEKEAAEFLQNNDPDSLGAIFCFSLYFIDAKNKAYTDERIDEIMRDLVPIIGEFLGKSRKLYFLSPLEILVIDSSIALKATAFHVASTIAVSIQQHINYKIPEDNIRIAIGYSIGSMYERTYTKAKYQATSMIKAIREQHSKEDILLYDPKFYDKVAWKKTQSQEIQAIIKNATFRVYYTPTLNLVEKKTEFYIADIEPYGSSVKDFQTVIQMASEVGSKNPVRLFESLIRNISSTVRDKKDQRIALRLPFAEIGSFFKALQNTQCELSFIIALREADLLTYADEMASINNMLKKIQTAPQIQAALIIDNTTSELYQKTLTLFDYFFVSGKFTTDEKDLNVSTNNLRIIENNYVPYNVPIVYTDLKDIDDIELGAHYSGTIFQCEKLALPSSRLEKLEEDMVEMIDEHTKDLRPDWGTSGRVVA